MSHSHPTERVLVVPSAELDRLGRFQGFSAEAERYLRALLVPESAQFRPRSEVEDDPGFKQIIPYVVFRSRRRGLLLHAGQVAGRGAAAPAAVARRRRARRRGRRRRPRDPRRLRDGPAPRAGRGGRGRQPGRDPPRRPDQRRLHARRAGPPGRRPPLRAGAARRRPPRGRAWPRPSSSRSPTSAAGAGQFETWSQICIDAFFSHERSRCDRPGFETRR